jgi:hypothetical protein
MLFNQLFDMLHLSRGWIVLAKQCKQIYTKLESGGFILVSFYINTVFGRRKTKLGGTKDLHNIKTTPLLPDQVRKPEKT